jgi:hypothetical protein
MNLFITILFWAGIVILVDGSMALLLQEKWKKILNGLDIQRVALIEIGVALAFLTWHYALNGGLAG